MTRKLQLFPDIPGNEQSCVGRRFRILLLFASIVCCTATPSGVILAPGIDLMQDGRSGMHHWYFTSLVKDFSSACLFSVIDADLWFPLLSMYSMSRIRSCSEIGSSG